jgi:hypothetical protein
MDPESVTSRTRRQVEQAVRAIEEARNRTAAATPRYGRPPPLRPSGVRPRPDKDATERYRV